MILAESGLFSAVFEDKDPVEITIFCVMLVIAFSIIALPEILRKKRVMPEKVEFKAIADHLDLMLDHDGIDQNNKNVNAIIFKRGFVTTTISYNPETRQLDIISMMSPIAIIIPILALFSILPMCKMGKDVLKLVDEYLSRSNTVRSPD